MSNQENENQNTLQSWATGKLAMFTIGLLAGIALYKMGVIQKVTGKLFSKGTDSRSKDDRQEKDY